MSATGGTPEERRASVDKLKLKLLCAGCGQLGHWVRECSKRAVDNSKEYDIGVVHDATFSLQHRRTLFLVDSGCARSVAGQDWCQAYAMAMKAHSGWGPPTINEEETFRFGPGN